MVYTQPGIRSRKWDAQNSLWYWDTNGSCNLGQTTSPSDSQKKKKKIADLWTLPFRLTTGESEKMDTFLDQAKKKVWNMKVMVIPVVNGALGTVSKLLVLGLEDLEIRGQVETIQITALLRSTSILRRVQEIWSDLLSLKL